jgi:ABC-2 type transport system ATP-binding protein
VTDLVIETSGLRKEYRRRGGPVVAVADLDLAVPRGGVHGFLGPNGSGKTTTIRMLLGLARPTRGEMRLLGEDVPRRLPKVVDRVGSVVEQPRFMPRFTGRRNLLLLGRAIGAPRSRVDTVLEQVGLADRGEDRYRTYSLGMKQRLAIAAALLKEPELLVLDEPTNGLDPAGIRYIRELVRELAAGGVTVLLSSHILAEVQQLCDSVSIIGRGQLLSQGRVEDLVGRERAGSVRVGVPDAAAAGPLLTAAGLDVEVTGRHHLTVTDLADPARVTRLLAEHGVYVRELVPEVRNLESAFLALTQDPADRRQPGSAPQAVDP